MPSLKWHRSYYVSPNELVWLAGPWEIIVQDNGEFIIKKNHYTLLTLGASDMPVGKAMRITFKTLEEAKNYCDYEEVKMTKDDNLEEQETVEQLKQLIKNRDTLIASLQKELLKRNEQRTSLQAILGMKK